MTRWKLVPVEATDDTIEAAADAYHEARKAAVQARRDRGNDEAYSEANFPIDWLRPTYTAMLSAAPATDDAVIERAAKVLYEEDDPWHKAWPWPDLNPEAQGGAATADVYRRLARAAIAALLGEQG